MQELTNNTGVKNEINVIRKEFRRSDEARYIHRLHGVLLVLLGLSTVKAGKLLGTPQRTVAYWVAQFKAHGLDGLHDREKSGRPRALTETQLRTVRKALFQSPQAFGIDAESWTNVVLSSLLRERYDVTLSARQCSRLLLKLRVKTK
jgi:putative transposase